MCIHMLLIVCTVLWKQTTLGGYWIVNCPRHYDLKDLFSYPHSILWLSMNLSVFSTAAFSMSEVFIIAFPEIARLGGLAVVQNVLRGFPAFLTRPITLEDCLRKPDRILKSFAFLKIIFSLKSLTSWIFNFPEGTRHQSIIVGVLHQFHSDN